MCVVEITLLSGHLKCNSFSYDILSSIGKMCPNLMYILYQIWNLKICCIMLIKMASTIEL